MSAPGTQGWLDGLKWLRLGAILAGAIVASVFIHEIGHCCIAWINGCPAVPTPAKEYFLTPLPPHKPRT